MRWLALLTGLVSVASAKPAAPSKEVAAALAAAKACPFTDDGFDASCEAYGKWGEDAPMWEEGKANAALLGLLGSKEPSVRTLVAEKLRVTLNDADASTVDAVLDAAAKETQHAAAKALAALAAGLDLVKAGKLDRAIAIAKAHTVADYTEDFAFKVASTHADPKLLPYGNELAKAKSSSLRNAAIEIYRGLAKTTPAACVGLNGLRADPDKFVSGRATSELPRSRCAAFYDKLLDSLEKLSVTQDVDQNVGYALTALCDDKTITAAQKTRTAALSRKISDAPAVGVNTRYYTLEAVVKCDPAGKAFVAKFKTDKNKTLADKAKSLAP